MFTGIIAAVGTVSRLQAKGGDARISINTGELNLDDTVLGDSIAVNGVCLTAVSLGKNNFEADVSAESLSRTSLGQLSAGSQVNLELAMRADTRFGGHVVSGHVDGLGTIADISAAGESINLRVQIEDDLACYVAEKGSVTIDAIKAPFNKLAEWRRLVEDLEGRGVITRAPGQELGFGGIEPETFFSEEGAGVFVLAKARGNKNCKGPKSSTSFCYESNHGARIDGMSITGADTGGGVVVNAYAEFLEISNLRVVNNSAFFAGGVRVGHPMMTVQDGNNLTYSDAGNDNVSVHHNTITQNGGLSGAGGGLALHTGSDGYAVTDNFVCGNFTNASGAGIAHYGISNNGVIKNNTVLFNENFN